MTSVTSVLSRLLEASPLSFPEDKRVQLEAAIWIHKWSWEAGFDESPNQWVEKFLNRFRSPSPVKLYRWQRIDHDDSKRITSSRIALQSWSRDKQLMEETVEDMNSETEEPTVELLSSQFSQSAIFTDFTMFSTEFVELVDSVGGHSECGEVLVYKTS